jgi:apolipoprotein N-acyltransferase
LGKEGCVFFVLNSIFTEIFFVKTYQLYLLALLSGLLLTFAWFPHGFTPLIFIGFVPLLLVEKQVYAAPEKQHVLTLFLCSYLTFITWNVLTTWWVKNASLGGGLMAFICNALLMSTVFLVFHKVKRRLGEKWQYVIFCSFWLTWEFLHLDWDLSWPWLTVGNVFAANLNWIQWYEYTGVFGGGVWIMIANCIIASFFVRTDSAYQFKWKMKKGIWLLGLIIAPIGISFLILNLREKRCEPAMMQDIVIVQPNIDPYNEKFSSSSTEQLQKMLELAAEKVDSSTSYLVFPETALPEEIWEHEFDKNECIHLLNAFIQHYPNLKIITGASTAKLYAPNEKRSSTARKFTQMDGYYDAYNTALQLDKTGIIQVYHKSKLVPGSEKLPLSFIFKHFESLAIDLGGTTGSLGMQDERSVFTSPDQQMKAAPVVCYESIYGEYVGEYINKGANFIAIITNDGWWGDTPGYKQHLRYGALRAIETRRWVTRSANTGISCFISPEGEIQQATNWWVPAVIKGKIEMHTELTFYTRFGDYIARVAMYLSLLLIIYSWLIRFRIVKK